MAKSANNKRGNLVLIGGAEDRLKEKIVLKDFILNHKVDRIAIIPSATLFPAETAEDYSRVFQDLGVTNIDVLDVRNAADSSEASYIKLLQNVDAVFFTGGDQVRLTSILLGTGLIEAIRERFLKHGLTIAGTSAGAAAAANPMTYDGDDRGLIKGTVKYDKGFGFIENITIDTHFVARGRLGRLTQFLCNGFTNRGIGIGENTSVTIRPDNTFYVTGSGIVTVVSTEEISFSNFGKIADNERITIDGIKLGFLQEGAVFDISTWKTIHYEKHQNISPVNTDPAVFEDL